MKKDESYLINWHEIQDVEQLINILSLGIKVKNKT